MLNKIITSSLLIAAATSLANAALTLEAQYVLGETGWNTSITNYNTTKQFSLVDATPNGHDMMNWGSQTAGNYTSAIATTISGRDSMQSLKLGAASTGGWSTEDKTNSKNFAGLTNYIVCFDIKLGTTAQGSRYLFSNGMDVADSGLALTMTSSGQLVLGQNKGAGTEGSTKDTVSGAITANTWTRLLIYVDNSKTTDNVELYKSTDGVNADHLATVTNTTATLSKLKFLAGYQWTSGLNGSDNYVDDLRVYSFAEGDDKVSIIAAAIPEPSMFGLIAGLGALALVGARRRRK